MASGARNHDRKCTRRHGAAGGGPERPREREAGTGRAPGPAGVHPTDERTMVIAGAIKVFVEVSPLP